MKKISIILFVVFLGIQMYSQTTLLVNPSSQTIGASEVFTTTIEILQVSNLGAWEFEVSFDPSLLQANNITLGSFAGSTGNTVIPIASNIDNVNGILESAVSSFGSNQGASGSGVLISIEWVSAGSITNSITTDLILQNEQILELNATPIPVTLQNGTITISPCYVYDLDCDCDVDIVDIQLIANEYGWTCAGTKSTEIIEEIDSDNAVLGISNMSLTSNTGSYEIEVFIENVYQLGGFEFAIGFNPEIVKVLSVNQGDFLSSTNREAFPILRTIDNNKGYIKYAIATLGSGKEGATGNGSLITIVCEPIKSGFSNFTIQAAQIVRADAEIIDYDIRKVMGDDQKSIIVNCYPNPFSSEMTMDYNLEGEGYVAFRIHDMSGNLILETERIYLLGGNFQKTFKRSNLKSGVYIYSLVYDNKIVSSKRIVIN